MRKDYYLKAGWCQKRGFEQKIQGGKPRQRPQRIEEKEYSSKKTPGRHKKTEERMYILKRLEKQRGSP